jgi:phage terminase small subunit
MTNESDAKPLSPLQERFIKEYAIDFNGRQAYMRAKGTDNKTSAGVQASRLLSLPHVQAALEAYIEEQLGPQEKRLLENVKFWEEVRDDRFHGIFVKLEDVVEALAEEEVDSYLLEKVNELPTKEIHRNRTADRIKASENLAKYAQMFVERRDVNVNGTVQIVDDVK